MRAARLGRAVAAGAALVAVLLGSAPAAGAGSSDGSDAGQQTRDRLAREFSAVADMRAAPDDICLVAFLNDDEIVAVDEGVPLVPASLGKIPVAAAAVEVIGADTVYTTEVFARSEAWASAAHGVLAGDLYLVGSGDPVLNTPRYAGRLPERVAYTDINDLADRVFASLSKRGISKIAGRVMGDDSHFDDRERDYTGHYVDDEAAAVWKREFTSTNLVGPLSGLLLNDGYEKYSTARGTTSRRNRVRAADPAQHAASVFDDLLEARGMVITNRPRSGAAPGAAERSLLGSVDSPPLAEILVRMLSNSDNTVAEMILKEVGRRTEGSARALAATGAEATLRKLLGDLADGMRIVDGSGLSSHNRLTCDAAAALLMRAGPASPLASGLAVAGETGTMRNCGASPPTGGSGANKVLTKSGTLNDSTGLAGIAVADNGDVVTFAMIANESLIILLGYCHSLQRALIDAAAHYTYGPAGGTPGLSPADGDETDEPDRPGPTWKERPFDPANSPFDDIAASGHAGDIVAAAAAGIMKDCDDGDGRRFCPDQPVTRARMAAFLFRALLLGQVEGHQFEDTSDSPYEVEIAAVAAAGITKGCDPSGARFCPEGIVTRDQMAGFLVRAFKLPPVAGSSFSDVAGNVLAPEIEALAASGVTRGCDAQGPRFCPGSPVTRGQMAAFLARALDL